MPCKKISKTVKKTVKKTKAKPKSKAKKKVKKTKIPAKILKYLEKTGVKHNILEHKTVYTAFDAAATMKKKLNEIAKSLLVKADRDYYMIVLPADNNLDFKKLEKIISKHTGKKIKSLKIPSEKIMEKFLKIKAGSISAFGKLYKIPVIVDKKLEKAKKAVFSSGSLNHSIEMAVKDFIKTEEAILAIFGVKKKFKKTSVKKTRKSVKTKKPANKAKRKKVVKTKK